MHLCCDRTENSLVAQITETLQKAGAMDYTVIVCASASESAPVQYIVPYSGCAMAEYFRERARMFSLFTMI